jgi:hypothetical protein
MMSSLQGENLFYPNPGSTCQKNLEEMLLLWKRLAAFLNILHHKMIASVFFRATAWMHIEN